MRKIVLCIGYLCIWQKVLGLTGYIHTKASEAFEGKLIAQDTEDILAATFGRVVNIINGMGRLYAYCKASVLRGLPKLHTTSGAWLF